MASLAGLALASPAMATPKAIRGIRGLSAELT
jgi:hypothetical protein